MDHSKVNGLSALQQAQATVQPPRASQTATDRFSRAMSDSTSTTANAPTASGVVRAAAVQNLTREAGQNNRDTAYRRWQSPADERVMSGMMRDMSAEPAKEKSGTPTQLAVGVSAWSQLAFAAQARGMVSSSRASAGELTQMLERMCSALYVGDKSVGTQRVVMALDHVMPGAIAEIVREGVHLSIRLRARNDESFRSMSSQRDALVRVLSSNGERPVEVDVLRGDEQSLGDSHG